MNQFLLEMPVSIRDALEKLNQAQIKTVFLVSNGKLIGSITDGDVRRSLLQGKTLANSALDIANLNMKFVLESSSPVDIHQAFGSDISYIPVIDSNGIVLRILERNEKLFIPLCEPNLGIDESRLVNEALDSKWISSAGTFVGQFETLFANYVNSKFALSVSNGTLGLVLALKVLKIGHGDEVLVPNLTFGATANAVIQVGAIPIFVDVDINNMAINLEDAKLKVSTKTKAIIPVHLYGNSAPIDEILSFSKSFNLKVIEDAAEAIGTKYKNRHVGTFGDIGVFSFYANKTITTGEGGMLVLGDKVLFDSAKMMRSHGFSPSNRYWHETWGTNMRLTNLQAALGVAQMGRIEELVKAKREIAANYMELLSPLEKDYLIFPKPDSRILNSNWLFVLRLREPNRLDELSKFLFKIGIESRRFFYPLNSQPAFSNYHKKGELFPVSESLYNSGICLPSSTNLTFAEISKVSKSIFNFFSESS